MKFTNQDQEQTIEVPGKCPETPLGRAIHLLGDAWVLLIVMHLLPGAMRFNALRLSLGRISSKTLSNRLKMLEELGFIRREAFLEIPPHVEYHLTEKGLELGKVIEALEQFGQKHLSDPIAKQCATTCPSDEADLCQEVDADSTVGIE